MEEQEALTNRFKEYRDLLQVNNGFREYYYLKEDGTILDTAAGKLIQPDDRHLFCLKTENNSKKKIALSTLYKAVYNKKYCKDIVKDMPEEVWKEIDDTEGIYKVSNKGRIKSLQGYEAAILKPYNNKSGYARVDIIIEGKRQSKLVHRLVAAAFLEPPQKIDMQLHHKDFIKENNAADNLCWMTAAEHAKIHAEHNKKEGETNRSTKPEDSIST